MRLNRSSFLSILTFLLFSSFMHAQAFNEPESVVYDAANDRYLVSNKGDGKIISVPRTDPNNLSYFYNGSFCNSLRGITIVDNVVWGAGTSNSASPNQHLIGFDLNTGAIVGQILISGGNFVNDVVAGDAGFVYVSDGNVNKIYKVDINTEGYSDLNFSGANGLLFDETNNRLLYTDDTPLTSSQISAIDLATNTSSILYTNSNFQALDGLTIDHVGNYYVSAWTTNTIYRYDPNFTSRVIASTGHNGVTHSGAADIFFDQVNKILAVPNFTANTLDLIPFSQLSAEDEKTTPSQINLKQNFPNPFNPITTIHYELDMESLVNITVFDLLGAEVIQLANGIETPGHKNVIWNGIDSKGKLVNGGIYLYKLTVGNYSETKKMVLLK